MRTIVTRVFAGLIALGLAPHIAFAQPAPQVFVYTGADQTVTVPAGAGGVVIKAWVAGGGGLPATSGYAAGFPSRGGGGGFATGTLAVAPGQVLTVIVGQGGLTMSGTIYGGGGSGNVFGGGGGGRSAVRTSSGVEVISETERGVRGLQQICRLHGGSLWNRHVAARLHFAVLRQRPVPAIVRVTRLVISGSQRASDVNDSFSI
jgi:hypothetical protein